MNDKIKDIKELSKISPVLAVDVDINQLGKSTIIESDIDSKYLGIINAGKKLNAPEWFYNIINGSGSPQIVINEIDRIDKGEQEKFYELLKYKAISNIELPLDCSIIVTAKNLKNVSESITRLCQII